MNNQVDVIAGIGLDQRTRKSHWPARLDLVQSASGLFLGLFMWGHMAFVSTILISNDAMWWVTKMFEGYFFFGRPYPGIVAFVVALVSVMFVLHGLLAMRKFPANYHELREFRGHQKMLRHEDTTLWWVQAVTGFRALFSRFRSSLPDARAPRRHRPLRIGRSSVERPLVAALFSPFICGGAARRRRSLPFGSQVGLVRGRGSQSDAHLAQTIQVGNHCFLSRLGTDHLGGLHEDRPRAPRPRRRALCAVLLIAPARATVETWMPRGFRCRVSGLKPEH